MIKFENVATPLTAATVTVLLPVENVPLLKVNVTEEMLLVTVAPVASWMATVVAGLRATPAVPRACGSTVAASCSSPF